MATVGISEAVGTASRYAPSRQRSNARPNGGLNAAMSGVRRFRAVAG